MMQRWYPKRGEIYFAQMDKKRPAVVISVDGRNEFAKSIIVVPISEIYRDYSTHIILQPRETGLERVSAAKCELITTIEKEALGRAPVGRLGRDRTRDIEKGVMRVIGVPA